ncbi:Zn-dependent peptidase ImmA (M78 family)/transcriptional regulator with XRE-family HTH domain [Catenulispora sp. GP43]|uniref:helix-turn-helix domain-containing protein n=1 Tax=Catenulispora sp. GP43 TaxID=3156263 RepID=UPI003519C8A8
MPSLSERVLDLVAASGATRREFARRIGLDESKFSKSITGTRRFSSLDLARIAEECDVTVDWLITGEQSPLAATAARGTGGSAEAALAAAERYSALRSDMTALGYGRTWQSVVTVAKGRYDEQGRVLAVQARARMQGAGDTVDTGTLATAIEDVFGADVTIVELGAGFDGLAACTPDVKLIVLATSRTPTRQRFTLAHELGHLLAGDDQEIHVDPDVYDRDRAREPSEMRANAFASEFLMPEARIRSAVGQAALTERSFAEMVCEFGVSPSTLAYRLLKLRLIDAGSCDRFKRTTSAEAARLAGFGTRFAQHVVEAAAPRVPRLLAQDCYSAYEAGAATLRPYANLLDRDVDELRHELESTEGAPEAR